MDPAWRRTIKALADACAALLSPSSIFLKVADIAEHHGYPFADALIAHLNSSLAHSPLESLRANTPADEDQLRLELIANTVHFLHAHTADIREWRGKHPDASDSLSTYLQSLLAPVLAQSDEPQRRFLNQVIHAISDFIIAQPVTQDDRDHWVRQASIKASETRNHITTISETLAHAAVPDDFAVKAKAARESVQSARSLASRALSKIQDLSRAAHDQTNIVLSFGEAEQSVRRLSQGLYVKRELESELLPLLCADGFGATVITGDAGTGKSSLLWRLYCLLTEHSATPVFLKAQWLIARPGDVTLSLDDLERAIDWLLGRRQHPSILVDTADLLAYDDAGRAALARLGRVCEERAVHLCLTSRVKEAAFLPSTWVRKPLGHYRFSPDETNSEFERAVMTHATAFTPDLTIPSELVNDLLDAVARGKPVASIATHPLTLRLMFEIYSPRSIPPNVDVTGLYIELWRRRVPRDIRSDNSIHVSSEDITSTVHWLANQMLQRGLPEMRVSGIAPASQPSSSFPHDLELARRRGLATVDPSGIFRFFHQTFFEFAAADSLLLRRDDQVSVLLQQIERDPDNYFLAAVVEQAMLLGLASSEQDIFTSTESILRQALNSTQFALRRMSALVLAQTGATTASLVQLSQRLPFTDTSTISEVLQLLPAPGRVPDSLDVAILEGASSSKRPAWTLIGAAINRYASAYPILAHRLLLSVRDRVGWPSSWSCATDPCEAALKVACVDYAFGRAALRDLIGLQGKPDRERLIRLLARLPDLDHRRRIELGEIVGAGGTPTNTGIRALGELYASSFADTLTESDIPDLTRRLLTRIDSATDQRERAIASAHLGGAFLASCARFGLRSTTARLMEIDCVALHAELRRGWVTAVIDAQRPADLESLGTLLAQGLPVPENYPSATVRQRWGDTVRRALMSTRVDIASGKQVLAHAERIWRNTDPGLDREMWNDPDALVRLAMVYAAYDHPPALDVLRRYADPVMSPPDGFLAYGSGHVKRGPPSGICQVVVLLTERGLVQKVDTLLEGAPESVWEMLRVHADAFARMLRHSLDSSNGRTRGAAWKIAVKLTNRDFLAPSSFVDPSNIVAVRDTGVRAAQLAILSAAVDEGSLHFDAFETEMVRSMRANDSDQYDVGDHITMTARRLLVRQMARRIREQEYVKVLALAFAEQTDPSLITPLASFFTPQHRVGAIPSGSHCAKFIADAGCRLASLGDRPNRMIGGRWSPAVRGALSRAPESSLIALLDGLGDWNPIFSYNIMKEFPEFTSPAVARRVREVLHDESVDSRVRRILLTKKIQSHSS